jgi:DNA-binding CsgD family transcriptional regulator
MVNKRIPPKDIRLSRRQKQCLLLTVEGWTADAIAVELGISTRMVRWHLRAVRERLGAVSTSQAVHLAVKRGLL